MMLHGSGGGVLVRPPRGGSWLEALPEGWQQDPHVVVVLAPDSAETYLRTNADGTLRYTTMRVEGSDELGLQIIAPRVDRWSEQAYVFAQHGTKIAKPVFVGRLSELPQEHLVVDDVCPLVFLRDAMSGGWINLKAYLRPEGEAEWN